MQLSEMLKLISHALSLEYRRTQYAHDATEHFPKSYCMALKIFSRSISLIFSRTKLKKRVLFLVPCFCSSSSRSVSCFFTFSMHPSQSQPSSTSQNQLDGGPPQLTGLELRPCYHQGLAKLFVWSRLNNETCPESECSICLSLFQDEDKVKVLLRCHHGFHSKCVDKWLRTRSICPLCRKSVLQLDLLVSQKFRLVRKFFRDQERVKLLNNFFSSSFFFG